jgi:DedD protein
VENVTKERLTGALILVAALVILVPEMLSGPDGDQPATVAATQDPAAGPPLRTYDMLLEPSAGAKPAPQETLTPASPAAVDAVPPPVTQVAPPAAPEVVAPAPATATAPTLAEITESARAEVPTPAKPPERDSAPVVQAPVKEALPAEKEKPTAAAKPAAAGKWWVQVGVFASRDNAQRLTTELKAAGFPAEVAQIRSQGKELHRVRAGPVADRAAAAALQARLAAKGHKSSLVAP